ncbi:O-antigen ligase family protein [uncultured Chitinophaga sp.]|uniref:O-antigen ligase family protein n=1 Tax=uncultured Chitinophaga sp. TaxID=339340 RepID=UPI002622C36E|nr:O-antigen ligase family protein [uncultured Chitinophaga sp.]
MKYQLKEVIIVGIAAITLFEAVLGILQFHNIVKYANTNFEIGGTFNNPSIFGNFFALTIPFLLALMLFPEHFFLSRRQKTGIILILCLAIYVTILSMSRSSWMGIIAGGLTLICIKYRLNLNLLKVQPPKIFARGIIVSLLFVVAIILLIFYIKKDSSFGRYFIYKRSLELSAANPITGYGSNSFGRVYNLFQADFFSKHKSTQQERLVADNINIAPSDFIQILIEFGAIGLLLTLLVMITVIYLGIKNLNHLIGKGRSIQAGGIGSVISLFTCSLLSYPLHIIPISVIGLIIVSMLNLRGARLFTLSISNPLKKLSAVIAISFLLLIGYIQIRQYKVQREWGKLHFLSGFLTSESTLNDYGKLYYTLHDRYLFISEFGMKQFYAGNYREAIRLLSESNHYFANYQTYMYLGLAYQQVGANDAALKNFKTATYIVPNRFLPKFHLFNFYMKTGHHTEAQAVAKEIMAMPVKVQNSTVDYVREQVIRMMSAIH